MSSNGFFRYSLEDNIHHVTALQGTGEAIKVMLEYMGSLFEGVPMTEKVRIMLDFRLVPRPSITEWVMPTLAFFRRQGPETGHPSRVAYIYARSSRGSILTGILSLQRFMPLPVTMRLFQEGEEAQAREWLQVA